MEIVHGSCRERERERNRFIYPHFCIISRTIRSSCSRYYIFIVVVQQQACIWRIIFFLYAIHTHEISCVPRSSPFLCLSLLVLPSFLVKCTQPPSSSPRTSPSCSRWYVFHGPSSDSSTVARAVNQATLTFNAGKLHAK